MSPRFRSMALYRSNSLRISVVQKTHNNWEHFNTYMVSLKRKIGNGAYLRNFYHVLKFCAQLPEGDHTRVPDCLKKGSETCHFVTFFKQLAYPSLTKKIKYHGTEWPATQDQISKQGQTASHNVQRIYSWKVCIHTLNLHPA
jgi:hypothetical protein